MNLCFVSDYHPTLPYYGGIAVYTQRIAQALARLGHQVHIVVAKADHCADFEDRGVQVHFRQGNGCRSSGAAFPVWERVSALQAS